MKRKIPWFGLQHTMLGNIWMQKMMPDGSTVGKSNTQPPEVGSNATEFIRLRQMAIEGFKAQSEMVIDSLDRLITAWEERNFCMAMQDSPVVPIGRSPRTDVLLKVEKAVLESGSSVVRLAGLYKADKGAHVYWLEKGTVDTRPYHILNLIHYESSDSADNDAWKDKGTGQLAIKCKEGVNKGTRESKPTFLVRNDVGKVLLNALLYPGIKTNIQKNSIVAIFHTTGDVGNNNIDSDGVVARTFLIKTKSEEDRNKLATAIQEYAPPA